MDRKFFSLSALRNVGSYIIMSSPSLVFFRKSEFLILASLWNTSNLSNSLLSNFSMIESLSINGNNS